VDPYLLLDVSADEALDILAFFVPRYGSFDGQNIATHHIQGFAASWGAPFAWVATTGQFDWGMILNVGIASTW